MNKVTYQDLDFKNPQEIRRAAEIHEDAPQNWGSNYKPTEAGLQKMTGFIAQAEGDASKLFLAAKDQEGIIVGFHWVQMDHKYDKVCAHIWSLWVHEEYRRNGVGRELKARAEKWAKEKGADFIHTGVFYANKKMLDYNLKLGFEARQVEMIKKL